MIGPVILSLILQLSFIPMQTIAVFSPDMVRVNGTIAYKIDAQSELEIGKLYGVYGIGVASYLNTGYFIPFQVGHYFETGFRFDTLEIGMIARCVHPENPIKPELQPVYTLETSSRELFLRLRSNQKLMGRRILW